VTGETAPVDPNCAGNAMIYIGDAIFVGGARTDVQAQCPALPLSSQAGWGYLRSPTSCRATRQRAFSLRAFAFDADGRSVRSASRR
jgi:hypothetical protein